MAMLPCSWKRNEECPASFQKVNLNWILQLYSKMSNYRIIKVVLMDQGPDGNGASHSETIKKADTYVLTIRGRWSSFLIGEVTDG
jgi:hypothetical protein